MNVLGKIWWIFNSLSPIRSILGGGRHFQHIFLRGGILLKSAQNMWKGGGLDPVWFFGVKKAEKVVKSGHFGVFSVIFDQNELHARHENSQNSLNRGLIVVLKVTVYRPTSVKNYSENKFSAIFGQKVEKTGFFPHFGGKWISGGVGLKELSRVPCTHRP